MDRFDISEGGFNPRARTGRDLELLKLSRDSEVSIHAPARGATDVLTVAEHIPCVSIHAPARGATVTFAKGATGDGVSIHAPARGATDSPLPFLPISVFQSTRPHGARLFGCSFYLCLGCFNPRARTGRDSVSTFVTESIPVSIHAPARGATINVGEVKVPKGFNPRARTGRDLQELRHVLWTEVSIHAPARGATAVAFSSAIAVMFQSTRPHGARLLGFQPFAISTCFNPRARTGRDNNKKITISASGVSIHAPARGAT